MNILIAGGTGLIGKKLTEKLLAQNHTVIILSRRENNNITTEQLKFLKWNGKEIPESDLAFDVMINLAGEPVMDNAWTKKRKQSIIDSRLDATHAFTGYINRAKQKPRVFINASAVGYYGNRDSEILTEEKSAGTNFLSEVCVQWETAAAASSVRTVMLRTGIVLDTNGGAFTEIMRTYSFGFGSWFGSGLQGFPWIHIDDEIGLILFAIENDKLHGALNLSAPGLLNNKEFIETLGKVSGKNIAFPVPSFILRLGFGDRADLLLDSEFVKPQKALDLGYSFNFPDAESALKNLLNR